MADYCLTLICPPPVEEKLLDLLLASVGGEVFTNTLTHTHPHLYLQVIYKY